MELVELKAELNIQDWRYGSSPLDTKITKPNFWKDYLPIIEYQIENGVETWSCVSFSALNCLEVLYKYHTGQELNFNDRYIASLSGTTNVGNYFRTVWDTIREYGLLPQVDLPFIGLTFDEYVDKTAVKPEMIENGKSFLQDWDIYYEFVEGTPDSLYQALGGSPLQVSVKYANMSSEDDILSPEGKTNHAVMLFNAKYGEYWEIFDHYTSIIKRYAWNYKFGAVVKPSLIHKNNTMPTFKNNTLLQLVEGGGNFGLYLDGKLYVDSLDKILASFIVRNDGNVKGMTKPVKLDDWNKLEKYNLKGETL